MLAKFFSLFQGLRTFLVLWASQSVSELGSAMTSYALIVWAYQNGGSVMDVSLLAVCSFLPSVALSFLAGAAIDRLNKRRVMLICDAVAAAGTLTVLWLSEAGTLQIWHLYLVNFALGLMNTLQIPASTVAVTLLVPKAQYGRAGGLQAFSSALTTILTPAFAVALLTLFGLRSVLLLDLASFFIAFGVLLFAIRIPEQVAPRGEKRKAGGVLEGVAYLRRDRTLFKTILFFAFINLLAYLSGGGSIPTAMILSRPGGGELALGAYSSAVGLGALIGSVWATLMRPPKHRRRLIFLSCALSFSLSDFLLGVGRAPWVWVLAGLIGNLPLPLLNANLSVVMRTRVPVELQGRVFAARDTLQYCTVPVGYLLGGLLVDRVFEPAMAADTLLRRHLGPLVGVGPGAGMAAVLIASGILGPLACLLALRDRSLRSLDD